MPRKDPGNLRYPQKSHPRLSIEEAKKRALERQRQKKARRRAEETAKQERRRLDHQSYQTSGSQSHILRLDSHIPINNLIFDFR